MVLQEINLIHKFSHSEKVCKRFRYLVLSETGIKVEIGLRLLCVSSFMVSAERLNVNGGRVSKVSLSYAFWLGWIGGVGGRLKSKNLC